MDLEHTIHKIDELQIEINDLKFQSQILKTLKLKATNIIDSSFTNKEKAKNFKETLESIEFYVISIHRVDQTDAKKKWNDGIRTFIDFLNTLKIEIKQENQHLLEATHDQPTTISEILDKNSIFIVHGHDEEMKQSVNATLLKLGLTPIILNEEPNGGRTIIEKFEHVADTVGFAIILLSPDDQLFDHASENFRARQNVILELGYFFGKLGRNKVHVLVNKNHHDVELPSDIFGIVYETYDISGAWKYKLAKELKNAGYEIDLNEL